MEELQLSDRDKYEKVQAEAADHDSEYSESEYEETDETYDEEVDGFETDAAYDEEVDGFETDAAYDEEADKLETDEANDAETVDTETDGEAQDALEMYDDEPEDGEDGESVESDAKDSDHAESVKAESADKTDTPDIGMSIHVTVNKQPVTLSGKQEYVFVDVFQYIDFDLSKPQGSGIVTRLNGRDAQYMENIHNGDVIDIYWKH